MFGQDLGQIFGQDLGQTEQQKQQHSPQQQRGARAKRARPFIVSAPAVVSVVLFDQILDQKFDPNLDQTIASREKNLVKSCDPRGRRKGGQLLRGPRPS